MKTRHSNKPSIYRDRGSNDGSMTNIRQHDPNVNPRINAADAVSTSGAPAKAVESQSSTSLYSHHSHNDLQLMGQQNVYREDALENVISPPKRKRAEDCCDMDCSTLRTVRGSSSFCSNSLASAETNNGEQNLSIHQSLSLRSPVKEPRRSNGVGVSRFPPAPTVDYRHFFTNTADLYEEPDCCEERGKKCTIVQTASGYEAKLKSGHEEPLFSSWNSSSDLWRGRSYSADLPHLPLSASTTNTSSKGNSTSTLLTMSKTPRKTRLQTTEDNAQPFLALPPMLEHEAGSKAYTTSTAEAATTSTLGFDDTKISMASHASNSNLPLPRDPPVPWKACQTPGPSLEFPLQKLNSTGTKSGGSSGTRVTTNRSDPEQRPQCPHNTLWCNEESKVETGNNANAGDKKGWDRRRVLRHVGSEDTQSPASAPFGFTSFPASLPRIHAKGVNPIALTLPSTEDLPSQWLNYDGSNSQDQNKVAAAAATPSKTHTHQTDSHSSPGTRSGNSNTQDDGASLKSDADDNSLTHGNVVRMSACTKHKFEPLEEERMDHGTLHATSNFKEEEGAPEQVLPCSNILFSEEPDEEDHVAMSGDHHAHAKGEGESYSPMHSHYDGAGDLDLHPTKPVDVSHDSTISSITTTSPTPYRAQARGGRFAPGKTGRPRPSMPPLSTPMELDSTDLQKVASGRHLKWDDEKAEAEQEDDGILKEVSGTRLNFNTITSPETGAPIKDKSTELEKTVVKTKIVLKQTFSHDTEGYGEDAEEDPVDEDDQGSSSSPRRMFGASVHHASSGGGMGSRIQFDFASSSEWHASTTVGREARFHINASEDFFRAQPDVSPIRFDSAASSTSHKSPPSFHFEDNQFLASPMVSSSLMKANDHGAHQLRFKVSKDQFSQEAMAHGLLSAHTSNLFGGASSFHSQSPPGTLFHTGKDTSALSSTGSGGSSNSSRADGRKGKVRPMPDLAAFDGSASQDTHHESFSSSTTTKTACPPTPIRTPAWAIKGTKVKQLTLHRLNSLQSTKVLADCNMSLDDTLVRKSDGADLMATNSSDPDFENELDIEIEQANFGRGCWNYDGTAARQGGPDPPKDVNPAGSGADSDKNELFVVSFEADFVNLGLLGSGAFADVYKGRSKSDGHVYAIKRNRRQFRSRRDRDRTMVEVKIMQKLQDPQGAGGKASCPYVLRFVRAWQQDGYFYSQTEICCRENCHDLISAWTCDWEASVKKYPSFSNLLTKASQEDSITPAGRPILPESSIWKICHDVVSGLMHIHLHGMVHFDIKPCNILFDAHSDRGCICKIGDFGMAGAIGTEDDGQEGDTAFMAPELLDACKKEPSADIFSLGLTLYNLAADPSWRLPSEGERFQEIRSSGHAPELPPFRSADMKKLIQRMITPERDARPSASSIVNTVPQVCAASKTVDKFLKAYVKDAREYERLREKEIALKYKLARDR
jgi:serine/threonine protein kinase